MSLNIDFLNNHIHNFAYLLLDSKFGAEKIKQDFVYTDNESMPIVPSWFIDSLKDIQIIPFWSEDYPQLLREIPNFPVLLFIKGDISLLKKECVTIVGTREITNYGYNVLKESLHLNAEKKHRKSIVSGLAYGVDSEVHRLCLKRGISTIGVIAGGLERNYFKGNSVMYKYLCKYGCVISEFPPGRKYFKGMFHMRNRILAGLSKRIFVIEAAESSGALNTACYGNTFGRDIYAVPNSIFCEKSLGCLKLVEQGAGLVISRSDFIDKI